MLINSVTVNQSQREVKQKFFLRRSDALKMSDWPNKGILLGKHFELCLPCLVFCLAPRDKHRDTPRASGKQILKTKKLLPLASRFLVDLYILVS